MTTPKWPLALLVLTGCAPTMDSNLTKNQAPASVHALTLAYGEGPAHVLDLYVPSQKKGGPLVVFVHGGAWQSGSRHEYDGVCTALVKQDIAAATVDYRLSPGVVHPAHAEDVANALGLLHRKAATYGYDSGRIFVVGHSAGGHIAATIATDSKLLAIAKPAGFVGLEGIYDIPDLAKRWPTYPDWFLKKAFGTDPSAWPKASPTRLKLVSKRPWLIVHSSGDELVDVGQAEGFADHLKQSGVQVEMLRPEGKTHFAVVTSLSDPDDAVTKAIVKFVSAG
jgi:acetyl esterase/lipase